MKFTLGISHRSLAFAVGLVFCLPWLVLADKYDTAAAKARAAKGDPVVVCSPNGVDGLDPDAALKQLKAGGELHLKPGAYDHELVVTQDRVIIRGIGNGRRALRLVVAGRDCVVSQLRASQLVIHGLNATVVDSITNQIQVGMPDGAPQRKTSHLFYNCATTRVHSWRWAETELVLRQCTVTNQGGDDDSAIILNPLAGLQAERCIMASTQNLFSFRGRAKQRVKLTDCLLFGETGLGRRGLRDDQEGEEQAIAMKDFRRLAAISLSGNIVNEKPRFLTRQEGPSRAEFPITRDLARFCLAAESPGAQWGIVPEKIPFLAAGPGETNRFEGEDLRVVEVTGGKTMIQHLPELDISCRQHLWWHGGLKTGDRLAMTFAVATAGRYQVFGQFVKAADYGIVQLEINGTKVGPSPNCGPLDCYSRELASSGEIRLGACDLRSGENRLVVTVVGKHPDAAPACLFGLDYLRIVPEAATPQTDPPPVRNQPNPKPPIDNNDDGDGGLERLPPLPPPPPA